MLDQLEFKNYKRNCWAIVFQGNTVGRITNEAGGCFQVFDFGEWLPPLDYSTRCEISKAAWEQARVFDVTLRLTKVTGPHR
jgi:hypothetical protein